MHHHTRARHLSRDLEPVYWSNPKSCSSDDFVLGYSQDNKSWNKSYKILSRVGYSDQDFDIYDISSNSWKKLHVTPIPDYDIVYPYYRSKSLKGKTYWFAFDSKEIQFGLISFDYTRERFGRLCLPYQYDRYEDLYLSVVKEDKLSVLLHRRHTREIWVTNKIDDETKEMSWSKLLQVERYNSWPSSFLVYEEKKIVVCCDKRIVNGRSVITVSVVGEDNNTTQVKTTLTPSYHPFFVDYVPSLIQLDLQLFPETNPAT